MRIVQSIRQCSLKEVLDSAILKGGGQYITVLFDITEEAVVLRVKVST